MYTHFGVITERMDTNTFFFFPPKDPSKFHTLDPKNEIALHFQQNLNICICTITKYVLQMALDTD